MTPRRPIRYETGLLRTSAAGCFPSGASLYGVLDLSGNVWEWTRSLFKEYPYQSEDGREDLNTSRHPRCCAAAPSSMIVRYVRCAYRYWAPPGYWNYNIGFRVVVSPIQLWISEFSGLWGSESGLHGNLLRRASSTRCLSFLLPAPSPALEPPVAEDGDLSSERRGQQPEQEDEGVATGAERGGNGNLSSERKGRRAEQYPLLPAPPPALELLVAEDGDLSGERRGRRAEQHPLLPAPSPALELLVAEDGALRACERNTPSSKRTLCGKLRGKKKSTKE